VLRQIDAKHDCHDDKLTNSLGEAMFFMTIRLYCLSGPMRHCCPTACKPMHIAGAVGHVKET
jgi:hypothetical protein